MKRLFRNGSVKKRGALETPVEVDRNVGTTSPFSSSTHSPQSYSSYQPPPGPTTANAQTFQPLPSSPPLAPAALLLSVNPPPPAPPGPSPPLSAGQAVNGDKGGGWKLFGGKQNGNSPKHEASPVSYSGADVADGRMFGSSPNGGGQAGHEFSLAPPPPPPQGFQQQPQLVQHPAPRLFHVGPPRIDHGTEGAVVGWISSHDPLDYTYVLAFCDYVGLSVNASKETARAIRKELKYGAPESQERALRLLGVMMRNTDSRFKQQIAQKKFLSEFSDLVTGKKTPPSVRDTALRVLSPIAYDCQRDQDLGAITGLYNKLKLPTAQINGEPLPPDDTFLQPAMVSRPARREQVQRMPSHQETLQSLTREAMDAKGFASVLMETLTFTTPEDLLSNEIVHEFHGKCLAAQISLGSHLDWVTVQAERARQNRPPPVKLETHPNGPGEAELAAMLNEEKATEEEHTLSVMLSATSELSEALAFHTSRVAAANEAAEIQLVAERSKNETRFDRARAGVPDENGNYMASEDRARAQERRSRTHDYMEGTSREPSPNREFESLSLSQDNGKGKGKQRGDNNPYNKFLAPAAVISPTPSHPPTSHSSNELGGFEVPDSAPSRMVYDEPEVLEEGDVMGSGPPIIRRTATGESEIFTPMAPSEKALGKLRRVSLVQGDPDPAEQQRLEQELRDRYAREYDADRVRRSEEFIRE